MFAVAANHLVTKPNPILPAPDAASGVDLTSHLDEQVLVERVRAGDPLAFEAIFRRYHRELCDVAESVVRSRAAAEDVVQDVFLRVWKLRSRWNVKISVRAYLRRAVRNVALRHASRAFVHGHQSLPSGDPADTASRGPALTDPGALPDEEAQAAIMADDLAAAAARLPLRPREVLHLSRAEGLSTKDIAERLGISPKTVEIYMTRALAALRTRLLRWRRD